ncbi:MAG: F0F1 ATP synthase subunit gamma [Alphaproteobacteria bacterium]|jgi:F-type H+-transporting ATPase subunit gamma
MPSLKSLKIRIASVKSTQKITKAMKMVAAAKLKKARDRAEKSRAYANKTKEVIFHLLENADKTDVKPLLSGRLNELGEVISNKHLLIVAAGDRGLCGMFNSSIVKAAKSEVKKYEALGKTVRIITIGKKANESLKHYFGTQASDYIIEHFDLSKEKTVSFDSASKISLKAIELFETQTIDTCSIIFNRFISTISQKTTIKGLIPLEVDSPIAESSEKDDILELKSIYEYEPSQDKILADLLPRNLAIQIFSALLENAASEQGARMSAMDNATRNAGEMIQKLSLVYNRTRQANITKELIEIISGAEAV